MPFAFVLVLLVGIFITAQAQIKPSAKHQVFLNCRRASCDETYTKPEVNIVDFVSGRSAVGVHIIVPMQ